MYLFIDAALQCTFHSNPMGGAAAVLRATLAAALTTAAPASSRGALACLRSCADSLAYPPDARAHFDEIQAFRGSRGSGDLTAEPDEASAEVTLDGEDDNTFS